MHNPAYVLENDTHKLLWDFDIQTDHLISARRPDLIIINTKKRICKIVDVALPADHRIKRKECEKKNKYLTLARELKTLWNMKVTIILIVIGAFGTETKGLLKELEDLEVGGREETIQATALLRTAWILRRVKLKESEKKDKYLNLARELKKLWNMKWTIVPIVIGAFGTKSKGLLKGLENLEVGGRVETIQMRALLRTARILRRVLETWEDSLSLKLQWKTIS